MTNELELPAVTKIKPLNVIVAIDAAYLEYTLLAGREVVYMFVVGKN